MEPSLFTLAETVRPPLGEWTHVPKPAQIPDMYSYAARPKWGPCRNDDRCVVTLEIMAEMDLAYEEEHGHCSKCGGDGIQWAGSSADHGHKYAECTRCGGSGAPRKAVTP